jgi:hypothetical protein
MNSSADIARARKDSTSRRSSSSLPQACSLAQARKLGRQVVYLASNQVNKETLARQICAREQISQGPVCVITCVEPCSSFEVYRNRLAKKLELVPRLRKCLFLYHYGIHPRFGFMNARIQTWFPFPTQICLNGREWLARQMDARGLIPCPVSSQRERLPIACRVC